MKIALELKEERKQEIIERLIKKGYDVNTNSCDCIWVYGIGNIHNPYENKNELVLENGKAIISARIPMEDIKYFEIHND